MVVFFKIVRVINHGQNRSKKAKNLSESKAYQQVKIIALNTIFYCSSAHNFNIWKGN